MTIGRPVTQTAQNYEGDWPDIGQQLANNLNVAEFGGGSAYRKRPESVLDGSGSVSRSDTFQPGPVDDGPLCQESILDAVELRRRETGGQQQHRYRRLRGFGKPAAGRGRLLQHRSDSWTWKSAAPLHLSLYRAHLL